MKSNRYTGSAGGKLVVVALALSSIMLTADAFGQEKKGATVLVTFRDGRAAQGGELVAVKPKSILILGPAGKDASFELSEIGMIKVLQRSKAGKGALTGLLIGGGAGILGGVIAAGGGEDAGFNRAVGAMYLGGMGGFIGLIAGLVAGISSGGEISVQIEGLPEPSEKAALLKLSKYARYREFR